MALRLYDTATRRVRDFVPLAPGQVRMYLCGPTVQDAPHVGHARSVVVFDILHRWLLASGYQVVYARNVTDIDDKILHRAGHEGLPWWALAERQGRAFTAAFDALRVLPPTVEPRATGHVTDMVSLVQRLLDRGHAYLTDAGVYFDVRSLRTYGALSRQRLDEVQPEQATAEVGGKRDPADFALWKAARPAEPSWPTPWGRGRPGWHLECSAMATRYLGAEFDIHGGGMDLIFPHHENEVAQSVAAGDRFARYWVHHGLVNVGAAKMSKSAGTGVVVSQVLETCRPQALRYALGAAHYRSGVQWTADVLAEAEAAFARVETFLQHAVEVSGDAPAVGGQSGAGEGSADPRWAAFCAAMDDDLSVPRALAEVHAAVREGNSLLTERAGRRGEARAALAGTVTVLRRMLGVLGLDPLGQWPERRGDQRLLAAVTELTRVVLAAREQARARRDFAEADRLRDALGAAGVVVEDTPDGPHWRLA